MRNKPIYPGAGVNNKELFQFAESITLDFRDRSLKAFNDYPELIGTPEYMLYKYHVETMEGHLARFAHSTIYGQNVDLLSPELYITRHILERHFSTSEKLLKQYEAFYNEFYKLFRQALEEMEYYELIPILDKNYYLITDVIGKHKLKFNQSIH